MWTIDSRCSQCCKKETCPDRPEILATLSPLSNKLNTEEPHISGPGDGILIMHCTDFATAPA